MLPKLIGLNGRKGSGKDTAGSMFVTRYGYERLSFAQTLKESVAALFSISIEDIERWKNDPNIGVEIVRLDGDFYEHMSSQDFRSFLQRYGTEAHRGVFGEDFWVEQALKRMKPGLRYVVTDARFPNELKAIHDLGGINIRIERIAANTDDAHASEAEPPRGLLDYIVKNDLEIDDLFEGLTELLYHHQFGHVQALREAGL